MHRRSLELLFDLPNVTRGLFGQPQTGLPAALHAQPGLDAQSHFRGDGSAAILHAESVTRDTPSCCAVSVTLTAPK